MVADIGAGDGQISLALSARGLRVVAVERAPAALARLRADASDACEIRGGDGLRALRSGEADGCVIAGLGGRSIAAILDAAPEQARSLRWMVLGPHSRNHWLLSWLDVRGWAPRRTHFVAEDQRLYQIIVLQS